MHELSIMQCALEDVLCQAEKAGAVQVCKICLRVGALSGVVPEALRFAFDALAPGTAAEGATLVIEPVAPRFWCAQCCREFAAPDCFADCPDCGAPSGDLRSGRELELSSMEVEYV